MHTFARPRRNLHLSWTGRGSAYSTVQVPLDHITNKPWREEERTRLSMGERILECFAAANLALSLFTSPQTSQSSEIASSDKSFFKRPNPVDEVRLREVCDMLEAENLHPVIGGSLAVMAYSVGRITKDVDLNLGVDDTEFKTLQQVIDKNTKFTDVTPLFTATAGKNAIPVTHTHFKYQGLPFDIYFNSNFATRYAIENAVSVQVNDYSLRFIPPESICSFKFANIQKKSARFLKDSQDVQSLLLMASESQVKQINEYVEAAINRVQGPDSVQLKLWRELMEATLEIRSIQEPSPHE